MREPLDLVLGVTHPADLVSELGVEAHIVWVVGAGLIDLVGHARSVPETSRPRTGLG